MARWITAYDIQRVNLAVASVVLVADVNNRVNSAAGVLFAHFR